MAETLTTYLTRVRRLLHDANADYFSASDLTADINDAIAQRDLWSGGSRSYRQGVALTIGQDLYDLTVLFPTLTVLDVINVWLIYGSTRVPLDNPSFTDLTAKARALTGYQNRPFGFARYGATQLYIAPAPGAAYTADFDLVTLSITLVAGADADPLPFPYTNPVPYYAAYQAKVNQRRYDEADVFLGYFRAAIASIEGARVGQMVSYFAGQQGGGRGAR